MHRTLMIFGTRPEIIKLGPVYRELHARADTEAHVFWTGQHLDLADGLLELFDIRVTHHATDVMSRAGLPEKLGRMLELIDGILRTASYQSIIVQGDTLSALAGAMAGFLNRIPVAHVEAGLRTFDLEAPWPEEYARRVIGVGAAYHFSPTVASQDNLLREGVRPQDIYVTGNTVVDALDFVRARVRRGYVPYNPLITNVPAGKKLVLVTGHRRESFGKPFERILAALRALAEDGDKVLLFPVHPNPSVRNAVSRYLGEHENLILIDPLRYTDFVYLLTRAWTVITDSGGIQEEAPSFGMPVVITREVTERPEVVDAGFGTLVGSDTDLIVSTVRELTRSTQPVRIDAPSPFGDGKAAKRIACVLLNDMETGAALDFLRPAEREDRSLTRPLGHHA